jgi:aspartate/methionine/tyrosine aminotransferase
MATPYIYRETDDGFAIDIDQLKESISGKTRVLIYNNYQNPLSASSSREEMEALAEIAIEHDLWVLSDDAYFEIRYVDEPPNSIVSLPGMRERTAILYTFSKKYAMTGWRIGGTIGPRKLIHHISRINVNDESCTNHFLQWAMIEALTGDDSGARWLLSKLKNRRDVAVECLNTIEGIRVPTPESTFYLFLNVTSVLDRKDITDLEQFRKKVLIETGVSFCTRNHFGRSLPGEDGHFIRLAYSGIGVNEIREGLNIFKDWIES